MHNHELEHHHDISKYSHHDAKYNIIQIIKQMVLLEHHYSVNPCKECIWKHLLTIQALAEEAATLTSNNEVYGDLVKIALLSAKHFELISDNNVDLVKLQNELRELRRNLMHKYL